MGSTRGKRVLALRAKEFSVRSAERSLLKTVAGKCGCSERTVKVTENT